MMTRKTQSGTSTHETCLFPEGYSPMIGESPTRPGSFPGVPPVDVATARLPLASIATAPTVSQPGDVSGAALAGSNIRKIKERRKTNWVSKEKCHIL